MPHLKGILGWSGLAALLSAPPLWAEDSSRLLERMARAVLEQSYHGSYVYERSGMFTTQDIWRQAGRDGVRERLVQTAGRQQEWVRHDGRLVCSTTLAPARSNSAGRSAPWTIDSARLTEWYSLRTLGSTRIASRPVTVIAVQPRDGFRYAHELYIDDETGLMLKSLLVDDSRELLERFQFTNISFDEDVYRAGLKPGNTCLPGESETAPVVDAPVWQPDWLPPGFVMGSQLVRAGTDGETLITSQIYSDGLASFTLFVEELGRDSLAEDLRAQLGPTVAVSRRLMTTDNLFLATVVGEIPPRAAERIADSLDQAVAGAAR